VLCALALLAAGCGAGEAPEQAVPGRATVTTKPKAKKVVAKAKAPSARQLDAANLRIGDLPKWRTASSSEAPADDDEALSACAGVVSDSSKAVVRRSKERFFGQPGRTGNFIASRVLLMRDERTVATDVKDAGSRRARACMAADFAQGIRANGTYAEVWAHEPIQLPAGVKGRAMRLKIKLLTGIGPVPVYVDLALVANRRVESIMIAFTTGRTMDRDLQKALITRLHTRAKAIA
jgi:hypothetical protein